MARELDVAALARAQSANVVGRRTAGNGVCHSRTHELHCIDAGAALEALASTLRTASTFAEPRVRTQSHASASKILHHEVAEVGFDASGLNRAQVPPGRSAATPLRASASLTSTASMAELSSPRYS